MRPVHYLLIVLALALVGTGSYFGFQKYRASKVAPVTTPCDPIPPAGLHQAVLEPCYTVSGTIQRVIYAQNGDVSVQLKLDRSYDVLINQANIEGQDGTLPVYLECTAPVPQDNAVSGCGQRNAIIVPRVHDHVSYTGGLLGNTEHGWNELHLSYDIR